MAKYRKKPVVVDAVKYSGNGQVDGHNVPKWLWKALEEGSVESTNGTDPFVIHTLEGDMVVSPGDFIVKGVIGELYSCKPDIFAETYEKVEN